MFILPKDGSTSNIYPSTKSTHTHTHKVLLSVPTTFQPRSERYKSLRISLSYVNRGGHPMPRCHVEEARNKATILGPLAISTVQEVLANDSGKVFRPNASQCGGFWVDGATKGFVIWDTSRYLAPVTPWNNRINLKDGVLELAERCVFWSWFFHNILHWTANLSSEEFSLNLVFLFIFFYVFIQFFYIMIMAKQLLKQLTSCKGI